MEETPTTGVVLVSMPAAPDRTKKRRTKTGRDHSSRQRFQNNLSFALTATTLVLLGVLSAFYGNAPDYYSTSRNNSARSTYTSTSITRHLEDANDDDSSNSNSNNNSNDGDYSSFSCQYIYDEVSEAEDVCNFAKTCNDGEGVWAPYIFCSSTLSTYAAFSVLSPLVVMWMVILFRLLGSTAEDFFSCSLEMFSLKLGLPPRFAGVTLLALANGAADVSATMSAIISDEENGYKLSLGALTGAAMLVGGVVSGVVVLVADGVKCRGALIRDVTALAVTIVIVWYNLSSGVVTRSDTTMFFGLYAFFVTSVLAADIYHRVVVLPRMQAIAAAVSDAENSDGSSTVAGPPPNAFMRIVTSFSNYDNYNAATATATTTTTATGVTATATATLAAPNLTTDPAQQELVAPATIPSITINEAAGVANAYANEEPIILHGQNGILGGNNNTHAAPSRNLELDTDDEGGVYTLVEDHIDRVCVGHGSPGTPSYNWNGAWHDGKREISEELTELWQEISSSEGELKSYERFLLLSEFPYTILRKVSIPIPCEGYYNRGFVALSVALSPIWFTYYLLVQHDINLLSKGSFPYFMIYLGVSVLIGMLVLRFAPGGEGNMSLIAATPIAFYGFVMAAAWIDWIADRLVALLNFIGIVLHIPGSIMGLTILAWGNSVGDLSANITMARKGLANMAMTACFAGPVFNILLGLGLGFRSLENQTGKEESAVSLPSPILAGFVFIIVNCATILAVGIFVGKGRIETSYGYVAVTLYTIYVITSITLEFRS